MTKEKIDCREGKTIDKELEEMQFVIQISSSNGSDVISIQESPKLELGCLAVIFATALIGEMQDLRQGTEDEDYKELVDLLLEEIRSQCFEGIEEGAGADD